MPRRPKPFFHRGGWVTNVGGTRTKLAEGRENRFAAEDALLDPLQELRTNSNCRTLPQLTVPELCDQFLDSIEVHRADATYEDYRRCLKRWVALHGRQRAREIVKLDLESWKLAVAEHYPSNSSVNHHIRAVKACWGWGCENEILPDNAFAKVKLLEEKGQERVFTPDEFRSLLQNSDAVFVVAPFVIARFVLSTSPVRITLCV